MSWLVHRWLLLYGIILFVFKGCQSLFLRHTLSGKCIAAGSFISEGDRGRNYWAEMVNNCLNDSAQFRYLDTELLQNIKTKGTFASNSKNTKFQNRSFIYVGKSQKGKKFENNNVHRLKQTAAGSLFLYDSKVNSCAQPNGSYVDQKKDGCSNAAEQKFTFGSVTQYGTKMKDVRCSPRQHMVVKRADYGDFNEKGSFNDDKNFDVTCSKLTNCQVKSLCGGKRSCKLTMDNNLLPSPYCSKISKQVYTEYTCVDNNFSTIITEAPNIRLWSSPYRGYIQIKHDSTWRYVSEKNWDKIRQKMLCQHLGFNETDANPINTYWSRSKRKIATGDLICHNTQPSETSCCIHLEPSTTTSDVEISYAKCKMCDKPLLHDESTFPDSVFSGSGDSYNTYKNARFNKVGWCASRSGSYLSLDLQKEYHITRVVVMGDRDQTKWSESAYSMKYGHDSLDRQSEQITGNKNGYRASTTRVDIYNVRYIKIESTQSQDFCLRIELCGEAQMPAPVQDIKIQPSYTSARVTWKLQTSASASSYITQLVIYLNGTEKMSISRRTQIDIEGLTPYTWYKVEIVTQDGSLLRSDKVSESFRTKKASVTNYGSKMENVHCSPKQHIVIKRAVYGDFYKNGAFNDDKNIDTKCSALTNCQVKSRCGGKKSCKLTMNKNVLPPQYCPVTGKEIYTEYECVDTYSSTTITAPNIRLESLPCQGFIQIKHGSTWRYVNEKKWDKNRQKMLCQHLGFKEKDENAINAYWFGRGYKIATGDLICYNTQPSGTSCCIRLVPSTASSKVRMPYAGCKICDKPLLDDAVTFPDSVFSGSGNSNNRYKNARFNKGGWCASMSGSYLSLNLQKEYHITRVVVMGDRDQTKWSGSYLLKYSRDTTYINSEQITGNQNGYQASTTDIVIYNVRYIKIQSTGNTNFCLRIELCGKVQTAAPVYDINITPYQYAARVTWRIRRAPKDSSYITKIIIYLNGAAYQTISRGTQIDIKRLKSHTRYKVEIETEDDSSQKSNKVSKYFTTKEAGKICEKPLLKDTSTFPNKKVFSGRGGSNDYQYAKFTESGWCPSRSGSYLLLDLQKEYHITRVVVMGNKDQTEWSESYSLKYSHDKTLVDTSSPIQIIGNQNGYQASTTNVVIYNARYIKIQSTGNRNFCLRIELCGEAQMPASVYDIQITPWKYSADVTWKIQTTTSVTSLITQVIIYLNSVKHKTIISPATKFYITGLKPYTHYTVGIQTVDGSLQKRSPEYRNFKTMEAAPGGPPLHVAFTNRSKNQLRVSWQPPHESLRNGKLTGYQVCFSDREMASNPRCTGIIKELYHIISVLPSTKYFVTVSAATSVDVGPKCTEISKITNGEPMNPVATSYSSLNLTITKPAAYIKEVIIIVQVAPKRRKPVEDIITSDLRSYQENTKNPYITAYFKINARRPLTFVIGDGKEYKFDNREYFNQPLKQNSSYIVFLRFFESFSKYSYYSTRWSKSVKTFAKPLAPINLKIISTALKKYTISWTQPLLPEQTTILKYYGNYSASQGTSKTLSISEEMRSVTIDVEFGKKYTFEIQVETRAGRSDVTSKSWISHSAPLKPPERTDDGYTVILKKPTEKQKIKTVALVMLQLQSKSNKPRAPENLTVENSPSSDTKADNVAFIAKQFNITEFQNDTVEISLRESKGNRRRKRNAIDVYTLIPDTTYRIAQMNTDGSGNRFWSYWSDPFTFNTKAFIAGRDGESSGGSIGAAVGVSVAVVVIIIALVLAVILFRRRRTHKQYEDKEMKGTGEDDDNQEGIYLNENGDVEENVHPPVPVEEFAHYVNEMKANENYEFQKEYEDLLTNTETSWEVAKKPFNKHKNRYGNIVTYDHCRVVLSGYENDDYINASYIDGIKENSYIATQGPTILTLNDMWRMVWEQRSYSIVMVTSLVELAKPKCEKYWPDKGTEKYGDIEVTLMKIEEFAYHVTHTLQLKKDGEEREVRHYYFQSWPDHGVPNYPTQLLAFRRHFRTHHMEQSGPIVVHCSAGVGRTGVFLAIDTILDKLENGVINSIDVFGQVCAMRERRMYMVQTLGQYIFIHEAILESILCGMNEVDSTKIQKEIETLAEVKASGMTGFQEKFKRLGEVSPKLSPDECAAGLLKGNHNKNRNKDIYPAESNRVPLQNVNGVEDSDYINAVFVQGYLGRDYFIATQSPLPNTISDFWRLVHLQKSSTIVLLNNVKDGTSFPKFWPTHRGQPAQYGSLTVQLDSEKQSDGIWTRTFILAPHPDLSGGQVVNIFHYTKWPDHHVPPNADAVITLTSLVENSRKNHGPGPVVVACSDGAGRTGTYIAISNLLERMKIEQAMDVFQSIKIIRGTRPQFVENAEQYQFCYTAIMAYLDGFSDYANFE